MTLDLNNIEETPHLLDILIEVEDVLDSLDVYVFKNWINGEVVDGPRIKRYWVSIVLKYEYKGMPDPRAGLRLLKHGVVVKYEKAHLEATENADQEPIWLVTVDVPRKLISGMNNNETDFYDDEVDGDDVASAEDMGVDEETGYQNGE